MAQMTPHTQGALATLTTRKREIGTKGPNYAGHMPRTEQGSLPIGMGKTRDAKAKAAQTVFRGPKTLR